MIIVLRLQNLVADAELPAEALHFHAAGRWVQHRLQMGVERVRPQLGAVHRRQHLHVAERIEAEALGMRSRTIVDDAFDDDSGSSASTK